MKNIFFFVIICFMCSCDTYKRNKFEYHFGKKDNEWINMYKTEVFFSCINKGYNEKSIFDLIEKKDLFVPYEPIYTEYNNIDTLADKVIKNITKPIYPHCDDCTEKEKNEILKKNYICATCLNYYASKELDSIAKKAYKKYLKTK
ncbi:hypothetical protein [Flavobacterium sp. DG2-3]|uniref:hypothetical protein n=1 Tax=Flavobacterium sp. DG2-3 TaxID=3068317 RepID=UPI00273CFE67|nr:hypothetical protein [Flavobacterium sp. DG2-3]MDP5201334.1 hypothetical protein [Flavobacterium sp. DG2-3]